MLTYKSAQKNTVQYCDWCLLMQQKSSVKKMATCNLSSNTEIEYDPRVGDFQIRYHIQIQGFLLE